MPLPGIIARGASILSMSSGQQVTVSTPSAPPPTPFANAKAVDFGASNSTKYFGLGTTAHSLSWASPFTLSFWFKPGNNPSDGIILGKEDSAGTGWDIRYTSTNKLNWYSSPNAAATRIQVRSSGTLAQGSWYHVAIVYTGNSSATGFTFYVDGAVHATAIVFNTSAADWNNPTPATNIGSFNSGAGAFLRGLLDELLIYNAALSLSQVQALYNSGHPGDPTALDSWANNTSWYRFGDGSDTASTINDVGRVGGFNASGVNIVSGDLQGSDLP